MRMRVILAAGRAALATGARTMAAQETATSDLRKLRRFICGGSFRRDLYRGPRRKAIASGRAAGALTGGVPSEGVPVTALRPPLAFCRRAANLLQVAAGEMAERLKATVC